MPGATSSASPKAGNVSPMGKLSAFSPTKAGACGEELAVAEAEVMKLWTGFCPRGAESCIIDVYVNVNYIDGIVKRGLKTFCRLCANGNQHGKSIFNQ
jgi:hypothetical protein